ncbi:MAG: PDC sensor domain-containing protein [Paracoccaceae bacterium]
MKKMYVTALCAVLGTAATATTAPAPLMDYVNDTSHAWIRNPVVIEAIKAQNDKHAGISDQQILDMDNAWRAEVASNARDMIKNVLEQPISQYLHDVAMETNGQISEVFVMDAHGLNVGQSGVTSDYWQGDEAKFQETYPKGPNSVHISEVEFDESTQKYQMQISMTIVDPDTQEAIGAVTFGVDATSFF